MGIGELRMRTGACTRVVAALLLLVQLAGCYHYVPALTMDIPAGTRVKVAVTDRGRADLAEEIGPGVQSIEGSVVELSDSAVVLSVNAVEHLDLGVPVRWSGEHVAVRRDVVAEIRERRLSQQRSWILAGLIIAGAIAVSSIGISGLGGETPSDRLPDDGQQSVRVVY